MVANPFFEKNERSKYFIGIKSYSRQEILDVITSMKDVEKPPLPENFEAVSEKPNYELEATKPFPR